MYRFFFNVIETFLFLDMLKKGCFVFFRIIFLVEFVRLYLKEEYIIK